MRVFVVGDIHGMLDQLKDVLAQAKFDYNIDRLISLGDVVDRGPDSKGVVDELLKVKDLIKVRGNHDAVFYEWMTTGVHKLHWFHGGMQTIDSYVGPDAKFITKLDIPIEHQEFFKNQIDYYVDEQNRLFIHGGYNRHFLIEGQDPTIFYWDRDMFLAAYAASKVSHMANMEQEAGKLAPFRTKDNFKRIFVGHTPTINWGIDEDTDSLSQPVNPITTPIYAGPVVNCDTGGCFGGKISLIDITNDEEHILYQS